MCLDNLKKRIAGEAPAHSAGMCVHEAAKVRTTAGELAEAAAAHPGHPVAKVYAAAAAKLRPGAVFFVEKADAEALLKNRELIRTEQLDEDGVLTVRKELGGPCSPAPPTTPEKADGQNQTQKGPQETKPSVKAAG